LKSSSSALSAILLSSLCWAGVEDHVVVVQHSALHMLPSPHIRKTQGNGICVNAECSVVATAFHIQMFVGKRDLNVRGARTEKVLSLAGDDSNKSDVTLGKKTFSYEREEFVRNSAWLVEGTVKDAAFGVGDAGYPINKEVMRFESEADKLDYASWLAGLDSEARAALAHLPDEELREVWKNAAIRFNRLRSIKIGDLFIFNVPGHGVIGVGVVTREYHVGEALPTTLETWPFGDGFHRQISVRWLIEPQAQTHGYKSLLKLGVLGIVASATINKPSVAKGRQLLRMLLDLA
jgi:hypothetical protein